MTVSPTAAPAGRLTHSRRTSAERLDFRRLAEAVGASVDRHCASRRGDVQSERLLEAVAGFVAGKDMVAPGRGDGERGGCDGLRTRVGRGVQVPAPAVECVRDGGREEPSVIAPTARVPRGPRCHGEVLCLCTSNAPIGRSLNRLTATPRSPPAPAAAAGAAKPGKVCLDMLAASIAFVLCVCSYLCVCVSVVVVVSGVVGCSCVCVW